MFYQYTLVKFVIIYTEPPSVMLKPKLEIKDALAVAAALPAVYCVLPNDILILGVYPTPLGNAVCK